MKRDQNWRRGTVPIITGAGLENVTGYTHAEVPGIALTESTEGAVLDRNLYSLTHISTGRAIAECRSLRAAKLVAAAILPMADWSAPIPRPIDRTATALEADVARIVQRYNPPKFRGETAITPLHEPGWAHGKPRPR